jgi:hypothetical protein
MTLAMVKDAIRRRVKGGKGSRTTLGAAHGYLSGWRVLSSRCRWLPTRRLTSPTRGAGHACPATSKIYFIGGATKLGQWRHTSRLRLRGYRSPDRWDFRRQTKRPGPQIRASAAPDAHEPLAVSADRKP